MGFSDRQVRALQRSVGAPNIRTRVSDGKELSYVEGWFTIAQANRIFGFDGWDRETVEAKCIQAREARGSISVLYTARVRVTVQSGERSVVRDGCGTGEGRGSHLGEAHDLALKAAETDATKRALVTFGKAFGLALYSSDRRQAATRGNGRSRQPLLSGDTSHGTTGDQPTGPALLAAQVRLAQAAAHGGSLLPSSEPSGGSPDSDDAAGEAAVRPLPSLPAPPAPDVAKPASLIDRSRFRRIGVAELRDRVDKSTLALGEPRRLRDKDHLRHVAAQCCLVCGTVPADAHHVRFAQPKAFGRKVSDEFTVPLCRAHHRELHHVGNERTWWHDMGIDPLPIARRLWGESRGCDGGAGSTLQAPTVEIPDLPTAATVLANQDARR